MQTKFNDKSEPSDEDALISGLVSRVGIGDFAALEELYQRYSPHAFGLALKILHNRELAEEAVQDCFLRFWKQPNSYNPERGRFITWFLTMVRNNCIDQLRRKSNQSISIDQQEAQEYLSYLADQSVSVEEEVGLKLQRMAIRQALDNLPQEQRYLIELAFFKGLTHYEIAAATGQQLGTVKSRIRQGLIKLKANLSSTDVSSERN